MRLAHHRSHPYISPDHLVSAHRARTLHPGLSVDLHGKSLARDDDDAAALGQPSTGMSKPSLHLSHVQAVLQADHLDQIVPDVCTLGK